MKKMFRQIENEYLRSRLSDVVDIENRVLVRLAGGETHGLQSFRSNVIVFAHDLLPYYELTRSLSIARIFYSSERNTRSYRWTCL